MSVWLVTGGSGFLGRQVLEALDRKLDADVEVWALGRKCPANWPESRFLAADLEEHESLARAVRSIRPEVVVHAAGQTPPAEAGLFYRANTLATVQLLDVLRAEERAVRVVLAGSAAEMGPVPIEALPVREDFPCRPAEAYGLSKWLATSAGLVARPPLEVITARVFNPIGPGQPLNQAFGRFAARLTDRTDSPLVVGDLEGRRDFIDVRDVARALIALAEKGKGGLIYHVGTGRSRRVGDGLDHLIHKSGRSIDVKVDPGLTSSPGPRDSRADISRIVTHTGWRPEVSWEQSLDDLWAEAVARSGLPLTGQGVIRIMPPPWPMDRAAGNACFEPTREGTRCRDAGH